MNRDELFWILIIFAMFLFGIFVVGGLILQSAVYSDQSSTRSAIVISEYQTSYQGEFWVYTVNSNGQILQVVSYCNAIQINSTQLIVQHNNQKWHFTGNLPYGCY